MKQELITSLAREYAEEINPVNQLNDYPEAKMIADMLRNALSEVIDEKIKDFEGFVRFLLRRFCLVEKSNAVKLCRLTVEHDQSVDYGLIDGLTDIVLEVFPEQYHQVAEELSNPEIGKEVEG